MFENFFVTKAAVKLTSVSLASFMFVLFFAIISPMNDLTEPTIWEDRWAYFNTRLT